VENIDGVICDLLRRLKEGKIESISSNEKEWM
jgi:hypothetical protein